MNKILVNSIVLLLKNAIQRWQSLWNNSIGQIIMDSAQYLKKFGKVKRLLLDTTVY